MNYFTERLKEPSTIRGLILISGLIGYNLTDTDIESIMSVVGVAVALVEIIRKE